MKHVEAHTFKHAYIYYTQYMYVCMYIFSFFVGPRLHVQSYQSYQYTSSSISSVFEWIARGSWENEAGGS